MLGGSFIVPTHFKFKVFFEYKNISSRLFFLYEKYITDNFFWFRRKSSSGLVDVVILKNKIIQADKFKIRYVMWWNFFKKVNGILWFEKQIRNVLLIWIFRERGLIFIVNYEIFLYYFS